MTNTLLEKGTYKLCWFFQPERHFVIYDNNIAVIMTKYEKEAINSFVNLTKGLV